MSDYLDDGAFFLREGSAKISEHMDRYTCIQSVLNVALGIERILKEILFRVNPLYILINPDFKNSAPLFYGEKIIDSEKSNKDMEKTPNGDVLTYSNSLLRACYFSKSTLDNKSLLFKISNYRDIIAHNKLSLINVDELKILLQRDLYRLVKSYSEEMGCSDSKFFGNANIKLADLSASLQEDVALSLAALFESHLSRWKQLKNRPGFINDKDKVTEEIMLTDNKKTCTCPACKNTAIIYGKNISEFNVVTHQLNHIGTRVSALKCQYCKLILTDYKYLDYLGLSKTFDTSDASDSADIDELEVSSDVPFASVVS